MALILDSSGVIALLNRSDDAHRRCVDAASTEDELIVPPLILVEVDYWCRKAAAGTAFASFVADIDMGAYQLARLEMSDVVRAVELADTYASLDLGIVDASVIALAERLRVTRVLTLDRRDFSVVRPRHCAALTLLPAAV
jgi:uncharacterized protein